MASLAAAIVLLGALSLALFQNWRSALPFSPPTVEREEKGADATKETGKAPAARFATINGQRFNLEVADDNAKRTMGLSQRAIIPEDLAMLFVFPWEDVWRFWMKDMLVPLDVIFLDPTYRIVDIQTMQIQPGAPDSQLQIYTPAASALYALEINGGLAERFGFQVGMTVQLQ